MHLILIHARLHSGDDGNLGISIQNILHQEGSEEWGTPRAGDVRRLSRRCLARGFSWFGLQFQLRFTIVSQFTICYLTISLVCGFVPSRGDPGRGTVSLHLFRLRMCQLQCIKGTDRLWPKTQPILVLLPELMPEP